MIYLVEHFLSIQGEGRFVGTPSIFFRLGGCNMRCVGFGSSVATPSGGEVIGCDTAYAVYKKEFIDQWQSIGVVDEFIEILNSYKLSYRPDIVFTGGEPLVYANTPLFIEFITYLHERGHRITFETNGTLDVNFEKYPIFSSSIFALSVKLSNSREQVDKRVNYKVLNNIISNAKESFYKFSLGNNVLELNDEIEEIVKNSDTIDVYCMPLSDSKEAIESNCEAVIALCKAKGYLYSDRLQIRIWDQIKGV